MLTYSATVFLGANPATEKKGEYYMSALQRNGPDQPSRDISASSVFPDESRGDSSAVPELRQGNHGDEIIKVAKATEEDMFYVALGDEQIKRQIPFLNEVLGRLLTLSTALMGGSIIFLKDSFLAEQFKIPSLIFFLFSLISALVGVIPYQHKIARRHLTIIKQGTNRAAKWKVRSIWISAVFLILGLIGLLIGVTVRHQG